MIQSCLKILFIFLILSSGSFCQSESSDFELNKKTENFFPQNPDPYVAFKLSTKEIALIEKTVGKMSLMDKSAQLVFPWVQADFMNEDSKQFRRLVHLVKDLKVGGLIFFEGDILNQVFLTNKLQELSDIPLLVASDFERGLGMRLKEAIEFPYNMAVAAANDTNLTYWMGRIVAQEAKSIGVYQNYAPMVDLNDNANNPIINIRAFSEDKNLTTNHALAFIKGSKDENVLTTVKHFPGHGATNVDSHKDLPFLNHTKKEFEEDDLVPFQKAINAGVKSVMIGHLEVPAYEPIAGIPATLSKNIVTKLLKKQFGFTGLVVTDAMNMKGLTKNFDNGRATVLAIKAGNDCILFPPNEEESIKAIYKAVENGEIGEERIDYSVKKILAAKTWLKIDKSKIINPDEVTRILNKKSHLRLAQDIADKSITLVKDENKIIPVLPSRYVNPVCIVLSDQYYSPQYSFPELTREIFPGLTDFAFGRSNDEEDFNDALISAKKADLILVPIFSKVRAASNSFGLPENQIKFISKLNKLNKPIVFMSLGNPYILSEMQEVPTYLCSYGDPLVSQKAMIKAIVGKINITGKLPISIPNTSYKIGDGLQLKSNVLISINKEEESGYNFDELDSLMKTALKDSVFPGGVLCVGHNGKIIYKEAFGKFTYDSSSGKMTTDAIFDLASVSKVIGTTTAAMILFDEGKLQLDKKVADYLPQFGNNGKETITVRNLLLHNSGLPEWKPFYKTCKNADEVIHSIMNTELSYPIGSKYLYSDLGMITLQKIIEKVSGTTLDTFLKERVFNPLQMKNTLYNPPVELINRCVPTEIDNYWRMTTLQGKVHDETAYLLGGVAGHAGLFSTAGDLAIFLQMMLQKGKYDTLQIIIPSTENSWTTKQTDQSSRGLGWDTKSSPGTSAGNLFSLNSFGHTGFTGTSVWVDKEKDLFVVLLTNRVYPTRNNLRISKFRPKIHDAVVRAISYN
ncbi:MAG: serine hydrolase [Ignavibacteriales bacterium]|nr:serine hydrolase [Ignavibacteriales bacterium]